MQRKLVAELGTEDHLTKTQIWMAYSHTKSLLKELWKPGKRP